MPLRTVIADDEPLARKKLRLLLASEPEIHVVAECKNGVETVAALRTYKPELLLLDIQMPEGNGFEILQSVPQEMLPIVIFTTAYDEYAIKAFEVHALDYLLKPFDEERFRKAIERAKLEATKSQSGELTSRLLQLLAATRVSGKTQSRFVIRSGGRVLFLDTQDVDWIEAVANYVRFHAGKDSYLLRESIGKLAERLDPAQFVRIHRSIIVNVKRIKELQSCNSGEYIVVLRDNKELPCSRGYRSAVRQLIKEA